MRINGRKKPESYYAVIFSSQRTAEDRAGYEEMARQMIHLAERQPGYLGFETARDEHGAGISVSYWKDKKSIKAWKDHTDHLLAQKKGRTLWYKQYKIRIALVQKEYDFSR